MVLEVVVFVIVVVFWALIDWAAIVGIFGALTGEHIERCTRCHRFGLTTGGKVHEHGCPMRLRDHVAQARQGTAHVLHAQHHVHFRHR